MVLTPDNSWNWVFDQKHQHLCLHLGQEWLFVSAFDEKWLTPNTAYPKPFSFLHAEEFQSGLDSLEHQSFGTQEQRIELIFNLIAARHFVRPLMPKSWFFQLSNIIVYPRLYKLVAVETKIQMATFIVIDSNEQSSLLMLIDEQCLLTENKSLAKFELIKVMNDRLMPLKQLSSAKEIVAA
ncbi:MAG: cell division protein ZapC [Ferrimonas sp.]